MKAAAIGVLLLLVPAIGGQGGGTVANEAPTVDQLSVSAVLHYGMVEVVRGAVLDRNGAIDLLSIHIEITGGLQASASAAINTSVLDRRTEPNSTELRVWDPIPGDGLVSFAMTVTAPVIDSTYTWHVWGVDEAGAGALRERTTTVLNATPEATADVYIVSPDAPFTVDKDSGVLANDKLMLAMPAEVHVENMTGNGTLMVGPDGSLRFTPHAGKQDNVTFTYRTRQAGLLSAAVQVTLTPSTFASDRFNIADCSILGIALSKETKGVRFDAGNDTGCLTLVKTHPLHDRQKSIPLDLGSIASNTTDGQTEVKVGRLPLRLQRVDAEDNSAVELRLAGHSVMRNSTQPWNGSFTMPTFEPVTAAILGSGERGLMQVRVGAPARIDLDRPALLIFAGGAGARVHVTHDDVHWKEIKDTCDDATNATVGGVLISAGTTLEDCMSDAGADLVVWTTHFSAYALVASAAVPSGGGWRPTHTADPAPTPLPTPGTYEDNETILPAQDEPPNHLPMPVPTSGGGGLWVILLLIVIMPVALLMYKPYRETASLRATDAKAQTLRATKKMTTALKTWAGRLRDHD